MVASLRPTVVDGTTCYRSIRDICIGGVCREIPCDLNIESNAVEDACGVCRGNGTSCSVKEAAITIAAASRECNYTTDFFPSRSIPLAVLSPLVACFTVITVFVAFHRRLKTYRPVFRLMAPAAFRTLAILRFVFGRIWSKVTTNTFDFYSKRCVVQFLFVTFIASPYNFFNPRVLHFFRREI